MFSPSLWHLSATEVGCLSMLRTRENTRACGLGQAAPQADPDRVTEAAHDNTGASGRFHQVVASLTAVDLLQISGDAAAQGFTWGWQCLGFHAGHALSLSLTMRHPTCVITCGSPNYLRGFSNFNLSRANLGRSFFFLLLKRYKRYKRYAYFHKITYNLINYNRFEW